MYFNFVKYQERTRLLNNERRFSVAEKWTYLIIAEWVALILITLGHFFDFPDNFIETHKWTLFISLTIFFAVLYYGIELVFRRTFIDLHDKYSMVRDWKRSSYRKIALFFSIFYFLLFPAFMGLYICFLIYFF